MNPRGRRAPRLHVALAMLAVACAPTHTTERNDAGATPVAETGEHIRVLDLQPGVTATLVAPARLDPDAPMELVVYALPNGNSTRQTIGRRWVAADSANWRYDIQHIGAQTRALRARGLPQLVVAYVEADTRSWPAWRAKFGYDYANRRIVDIVDQVRAAVGNPSQLSVTLTGHSGGGSFMIGFIDGQAALPPWLTRIAFLDANYSVEARHVARMRAWLAADARRRLVVMAYDDREIMLDGKKVVSDSGGTWRATARMMAQLDGTSFTHDTVGGFRRDRSAQIEVLRHPNPQNRILHTAMIGDMNGYMHAMLSGRPSYERGAGVLQERRAYGEFVHGALTLPAPVVPAIPDRSANALTGSAFIASVASLPREQREAAVRRELLAGNLPSFLRALRTVTVSATDSSGRRHTLAFEVMPDYLAIGSDDDFVRMPMDPYTAQAFADAFGFALPTRKLVNDIWAAAPVHVEPRPLTEEREAAATFLQHHRIIAEQLRAEPRGAFVAGIKKDVVVTNRLAERANRVAIYGWHYPSGQPIQPLYVGHVDWYVDYSHGIRPVRRMMRVDGEPVTFETLATDATRWMLVSDEGVLSVTRYPVLSTTAK